MTETAKTPLGFAWPDVRLICNQQVALARRVAP